MNFGNVPVKDLDRLDLTLPPEPGQNEKILAKAGKAGKTKFYTGLGKWGRKEFVGVLYPKGTKEKDFAELYLKHFNSIELNATHYKLFDEKVIQSWADKSAGTDFKFCPKVYQGISHFGALSDKKFLTDVFTKNIRAFGKQLGPVLFQVSDKFGPKRKQELLDYLELLPDDIQFFLEIRHPEWFEDGFDKDLLKALIKLKIGAVITDAAGRRDACHMYLTVPKVFIRYVGNDLHKTDYTRIDEWAERLQYWQQHGLKEAFFFPHPGDEKYGPEMAQYVVKQLNKKCNAGLKPVELLGK